MCPSRYLEGIKISYLTKAAPLAFAQLGPEIKKGGPAHRDALAGPNVKTTSGAQRSDARFPRRAAGCRPGRRDCDLGGFGRARCGRGAALARSRLLAKVPSHFRASAFDRRTDARRERGDTGIARQVEIAIFDIDARGLETRDGLCSRGHRSDHKHEGQRGEEKCTAQFHNRFFLRKGKPHQCRPPPLDAGDRSFRNRFRNGI